MRNRKGLTLVEIIVSLALIGIIAIGIIPAFGMQFKMLVDTKSITTGAFDAQGEMENLITEAEKGLKGTVVGNKSISIWGTTISAFEIISPFPSNPNKSIYAYLSKQLALLIDSDLLDPTEVKIWVGTAYPGIDPGSTKDLTAKITTVSPAGLYAHTIHNTNANWSQNIFIWYKSKPGNSIPIFPEDFEIQERTVSNSDIQKLNNSSGLSNRYIIVSITPVDTNGVRGKEGISTNKVLVVGNEWRTLNSAWVDKNADENYTTTLDVEVRKPTSATWPLLLTPGFDSKNKFPNHDITSPDLDPIDGSLFVPMRISPPTLALSTSIGEILVDQPNYIVNWDIDKAVNIATNILVSNDTDVNILSRDGNITLWQFVQMNAAGNDAVYLTGLNAGRAATISNGSLIQTTRDIFFESGVLKNKVGDIILQPFSSLDGRNISLAAKGYVRLLGDNNIISDDSILFDSTIATNEFGSRDISINDSVFTINNSSTSKAEINIFSRNSLSVTSSAINKSSFNANATSANSKVTLKAPDGIKLTYLAFNNLNVDLYNDTYMTGGSWTSTKTIKVIDGKTITFDGLSGTKKVNNGNLSLGNTGEVNFASTMANDLLNPLEILFGNGSSSNRVVITTNYSRNISYAGDKDNVLVTGDYQELGTSPTNMQYQVRQVSGYGTVTNLTCSFDKDTQSIIVNADTTGDVSANYELSVRDKFGDGNIIGKIIFKVRALEGETIPQITFVGATVDIYTVTFNNNGGTSQANPTSMTVADSETLAALPTPPNGPSGYEFAYWSKSQAVGSPNNFTLSTPVLSNLTVYAQYTMLPIYTVTFSKDTGTTDASPTTITAIKGSGTGSLPTIAPTKPGGYRFDKWTTGTNGTGTEFTATTPVLGNITVYAKYIKTYVVTFSKNTTTAGSTDPSPTTITIDAGSTTVGTLPTTNPTRPKYTFGGWYLNAAGTGTKITATTPITAVSADFTLYAKWYKYFATDIDVGEYINIQNTSSNNVTFQKISDTQVLLRGRRSSTGVNYNTTVSNANAYEASNFNQTWITSSGLLDLASAQALSSYQSTILDNNYTWWLIRTSSSIYNYVDTSGALQTRTNSTTSYFCRPYMTLNNTNLVVDTGSGTSGSPYTLMVITP
jgi:uncharacterized repeat protein (TIGR02543 family)/prepilin-type N-terminal cleavage/methylation domain-containing protein